MAGFIDHYDSPTSALFHGHVGSRAAQLVEMIIVASLTAWQPGKYGTSPAG
jgi:hypothetical protein